MVAVSTPWLYCIPTHITSAAQSPSKGIRTVVLDTVQDHVLDLPPSPGPLPTGAVVPLPGDHVSWVNVTCQTI